MALVACAADPGRSQDVTAPEDRAPTGAPQPPPGQVFGVPVSFAPASPCASAMAHVAVDGHEFCIDRFECSVARRMPSGDLQPWPGNQPVAGLEQDIVAQSQKGQKPQGYISAVQAGMACAHAGKRLCRSDEWVSACRGRKQTLYPYGQERRLGACNDRPRGPEAHPVVRLFRSSAPPGSDPDQMWTATWLNDPRLHELPDTVAPTGAFSECVNGFGVADMVGNLHEWVADADGTFRGGFFMDTRKHGEGCEYVTRVHGPRYRDYSTGFRCCSDVPSRD